MIPDQMTHEEAAAELAGVLTAKARYVLTVVPDTTHLFRDLVTLPDGVLYLPGQESVGRMETPLSDASGRLLSSPLTALFLPYEELGVITFPKTERMRRKLSKIVEHPIPRQGVQDIIITGDSPNPTTFSMPVILVDAISLFDPVSAAALRRDAKWS